jgi:2Fe-2S ferredoxin
MATVNFIESGGARRTVDAPVGASLMSAAVTNKVKGIPADCGGQCSCATCHVYVDPAWIDRVGAPGPLEDSMLDDAPDRQETSRLSCQIKVTPELEGLVVRVPGPSS